MENVPPGQRQTGRQKPIKILHVITGLGAGGAERQLATLVLNSDPDRVRHEVVSLLDTGIWGERLRARGITVHALGASRGLGSLFALPRLAGLIRASSPDLVQTWLYHADLAGLLASWIGGAPPVIWTLRCSSLRFDIYGWRTKLLVRLLAALSRRPAAIAANSAAGWRWHQSLGYRPRHAQVIPNGIDCAEFHPDTEARAAVRHELGLPAGACLIGNLSRHDPMKDHPTLFSAFARAGTDAWLVLAGDGTGPNNGALDRQIAGAGIDPARVLRLGQRRDVPRLLAALDLAVLSSSFGEGFPNIVAEAMACGVPCVGTSVGDTELVVGDCGTVVEPGNPVALADGISKLLALDPQARTALGQQARRRIEAMFSVPAMVAAYAGLYQDVLTRTAG